MQTEFGEFQLHCYEDHVHRDLHLALAQGTLAGPALPLVRVHLADTLRDLLGVRGDARAWTLRACDAAHRRRAQWRAGDPARAGVAARSSPMRCRACDRADACGAGRAAQSVLRTYGIGAQILKDLGVRRMRVLSAPKQLQGISAFDLEVAEYVGHDTP